MGTSTGGLASLGGGGARMGWRAASTLAVFLTTTLCTGILATADTVMKRAVLGTIVEAGALQLANEPGAWTSAGEGTPVVEESELRTGAGRTTLVALGKHGVVGLREGSHLSVGRIGPEGLPLSLDGEGSLSFRLPLTTNLSIYTDAALVKGPTAGEVPSGYTSVQGIITRRGQLTTVSVLRGKLRVSNRDAEHFVWVSDGEQATIAAAQETPLIARMTAESKKEAERRVGVLGWFGTKTGLLVGGATAAAVGGGVGAAAATGAFSSDDESSTGTVPAQASPFRN